MEIDSAENETLTKPAYRLYPERFSTLILFSLLAVYQNLLWMTYTPIAQYAKLLYDWSDVSISVTIAWGSIGFFIAVTFSSYLIAHKGLRVSVLVAAWFCCIGGALRSLSFRAGWTTTVLVHLGSFSNALAGPLMMSLPPRLSACWFSPEWRTTTTSISALAPTLGSLLAFATGLLVRSQQHVILLLVVESVVGALLLALTHFFYVEAPPTAPSPSSANVYTRPTLTDGICGLLKHRVFLLLLIGYAAINGTFVGFSSVLTIILEPLGFSQIESSALGVLQTLLCIFGGFLTSFISDRLRDQQRPLVALIALSCISFAGFSCAIRWTVGSLGKIASFFFCTVASASVGSTTPLFLELASDISYPIQEDVSSCMLALSFNFVCLLFVVFVSLVSAHVINIIVTGTAFVCTLLFFMLPIVKNRSSVDFGYGIRNSSPAPGTEI